MKTRLTIVLLLMGLASVGRGQSPLPPTERLTSFDPDRLQLERRGERWLLLAGERVLKDCGTREQEAHQVWHLIQELRLNQHGVIGGKEPVMEYWLVNGQAPTALPRGLRVLPINLDELHLEQAQGFWVLRETTRVLFNFGTDEQPARQAMTVLKTYGFNRVGIVGQAVPLMLVFIAHPEGSGARTVKLTHEALKPPDRGAVPAAPPVKVASFYPAPILPPIRSGFQNQQSLLLERGRPARMAQLSTDAVPEVAVLGASATRATFDYRRVQVRRENGDWMLAAGGQTLARFGSSERHAQLAHAAVMHYRLTEVHQIGAPESGVRYFLSNGQAPRGLMIGLMGDNFQPEQLSIQQVHDKFVVAQRGRAILEAGTKEEDARELLQVIRRYGFDHICRIRDNDKDGLTLLVKSY